MASCSIRGGRGRGPRTSPAPRAMPRVSTLIEPAGPKKLENETGRAPVRPHEAARSIDFARRNISAPRVRHPGGGGRPLNRAADAKSLLSGSAGRSCFCRPIAPYLLRRSLRAFTEKFPGVQIVVKRTPPPICSSCCWPVRLISRWPAARFVTDGGSAGIVFGRIAHRPATGTRSHASAP